MSPLNFTSIQNINNIFTPYNLIKTQLTIYIFFVNTLEPSRPGYVKVLAKEYSSLFQPAETAACCC